MAREKLTEPMHQRYMEDKVTTSGETKGCIIAAMHHSVLAVDPHFGKQKSARFPLQPDSVTWETIRECNLSLDQISKISRNSSYPGASRKTVSPGLPAEREKSPRARSRSPISKVDTPSPRTSSPTSSSSSSSSDDMKLHASSPEPVAEVNLPLQQETSDRVQWFIQAGHRRAQRLHFVQHTEEDGSLIPWCRSEAFSRFPEEMGWSISQALLTPFDPCPLCIARSTTEVTQILKDAWP